MPPDSSCFTPLNLPDHAVPESMASFVLSAEPCTDLWRKPPASDISTAPVLYTALRYPFVSAEVAVSADWRLEWDQAGLVIFAGQPPGRNAQQAARPQTGTGPQPQPTTATTADTATEQASSPAPPADVLPAYVPPPPAPKWVKVGLEYHNGTPSASSVVATSDGADWAVTPLPAYQSQRFDLRVKLERIGHALWVYYEDQMLGWRKLREVTWFFWGVPDKSVRVGVYLSRPANWPPFDTGGGLAGRDLSVEFEGLEIY